jgi:hypothetical protein
MKIAEPRKLGFFPMNAPYLFASKPNCLPHETFLPEAATFIEASEAAAFLLYSKEP